MSLKAVAGFSGMVSCWDWSGKDYSALSRAGALLAGRLASVSTKTLPARIELIVTCKTELMSLLWVCRTVIVT